MSYGQHIKLRGINTNNANLRVLTKIVARENLKFGIQPNVDGFRSMVKNSVAFNYRGEPEKTANSIICTQPQGIETTQLETQALTMIIVCRVKKDTSGASNPFTTSLGGSNTGGAGFSLLISGINFSTIIYAEKDGTQQAIITSMGPFITDTDGLQTKWAWLAITIDPATNRHAYFNSHTLTGYLSNDATPGGYNLASRNVTAARPIFVGTVLNPSASNIGKPEIAISYDYDRPLSEAELRQQYAYDKDRLSKVGITI